MGFQAHANDYACKTNDIVPTYDADEANFLKAKPNGRPRVLNSFACVEFTPIRFSQNNLPRPQS